MTGTKLGRGKRRKVERGWGDKKSSRLFSFCAFPSLSFPFLLDLACKLLPSLPSPSALLPTPPPFYLCLHLLVLKDGHEMLWTGCEKVIALWPTLTYMYMYIGVRYSWTAATATSPQQLPLYNGHFFGGQSIHSLLFQPHYNDHFLLFLKWLLERGWTVIRKNSQTASFFLCTSWICVHVVKEYTCICYRSIIIKFRLKLFNLQGWFSISSVSWP